LNRRLPVANAARQLEEAVVVAYGAQGEADRFVSVNGLFSTGRSCESLTA
jgi:hypothetical protein